MISAPMNILRFSPLSSSMREATHATQNAATQNALERLVVGCLMEDGRAEIPAIEGVIQSASLVCSWWSWHPGSILHSQRLVKMPDPFYFSASAFL
jgi:hypothetical protein